MMKTDENVANISEILERRRTLQRSNSFSTVTSSTAEAFIRQQVLDLEKLATFSENILTLNSKNDTKFSNKDGIHVGDVIYVNYIIPSAPNDTSSNCNDCNNQKLESDSSCSIISIDNDKILKKVKLKKCLRICLSCIVIAVMIVIATVLAVFKFEFLEQVQRSNNLEKTTSFQIDTTKIITSTETPELWMSRNEWNANPPLSQNIPKLQWPISRIIVSHTAGNSCNNKSDCIQLLKYIQAQHADLDDIPYNFLIGGDGTIYEGRGFENEGQLNENLDGTEYNSIGISITFIGNYKEISPSDEQLDLLKSFIRMMVENGILNRNYIVIRQDDLVNNPIKANALNDAVTKMENYYPLQKIYRRSEWNAERHRGAPEKFNRTLDWVLIGHTVTSPCYDYNSCAAKVRSLQTESFERKFDDILYNFIIGTNGMVYEGRGWDNIAAHSQGLNSKMIGLGVIGDFNVHPPNESIIHSILKLLSDAMVLGKLTNDYKINGRSDFNGPGPGEPFMKIIREWCRYGNRTMSC